jgi:hypothetical protein
MDAQDWIQIQSNPGPQISIQWIRSEDTPSAGAFAKEPLHFLEINPRTKPVQKKFQLSPVLFT